MLPNSICTSASHRAWSFEAVSLCLAKLGPPRSSTARAACAISRSVEQLAGVTSWWQECKSTSLPATARHPEPAKLAPTKPVLFWHHQLQHPCPDSSLGFCGPWCSGWAQGRAATLTRTCSDTAGEACCSVEANRSSQTQNVLRQTSN